MKPRKKPSDTLMQGMGTGRDIIKLFTALLNAAGVQARLAYCSGRDDSFFDSRFLDPHFLNRMQAAVRVGEEWKFYDPASPYLEPGMLVWPEEGVQSLILDPKKPVFVKTPFSSPKRSRAVRKTSLKLQDDGTLEGTVEHVYRGHLGAIRKTLYDGFTERERTKEIVERVQRRLSTAEVSDIEMKNVTSVREPYTVRYRIRVPGYAQRVGKRLLLQPSFFRMNVAPEFQTSKRRYELYFQYSWSERDEVTIELPENYELETDEPPKSSDLGDIGRYEGRMGLLGNNKLVYVRNMRFGDDGAILFPAAAYPQIKQLFDFVHEQDNHVVTLTQKTSGH